MMIKQVLANDPRFKANKAIFKPGLNVILADRDKKAKERDTTNGAGKTTFLEIIHYCLGKDVSKDKQSIFKKSALEGWIFTVVMAYKGKEIKFSRPVGNKSNVITIETPIPLHGFNDYFSVDLPSGEKRITITRSAFTEAAGPLFFDLPLKPLEPYYPKFRSLLSYLIRVGKDAYHSPFSNNRKQQQWDEQVCTTFLLRLNPDYAGRWQALRDKEKRFKVLGEIQNINLPTGKKVTKAALFAKLTRLKEQVEKDRVALNTFRVHEQYEAMEQLANNLTEQIHQLVNDNISDEQLIAHYQEVSREEEVDINPSDVEKIYKEVGVAFPDQVRKRLEEVKAFHEAVIANRRYFVEREIEKLKTTIEERRVEIKKLTDRRAEILAVLSTCGALEDYMALERQYYATLDELKEVERAYNERVELEEGKSAIRREREDLKEKAEMDLSEREELRKEAILLFNQNSQVLYEVPGDLLIEVTDSGYKFEVEIERARSQGISNMKIFCYDLMLMQLPRINRFPKFLVHDSLIFEGVDNRQKAKAIELAAKEAGRLGFQYIMTINRDDVPWGDFSPGFENQFREAVRLELNDQEDGGLLGFQV
ncbi:hypothetical protein E308F_10960 [Moorella sp. E308F]|uniref:ABC-three component system protein n=1 Tax=Moorella sp. E308F TaxID=2572682 RepID=UPI0010FFB2D5|nr:ABC-three component system protein [Moorella sp. E308F]GEA14852.1 hypothetical protein E308F_10960 [Moorella sp. E308F]